MLSFTLEIVRLTMCRVVIKSHTDCSNHVIVFDLHLNRITGSDISYPLLCNYPKILLNFTYTVELQETLTTDFSLPFYTDYFVEILFPS